MTRGWEGGGGTEVPAWEDRATRQPLGRSDARTPGVAGTGRPRRRPQGEGAEAKGCRARTAAPFSVATIVHVGGPNGIGRLVHADNGAGKPRRPRRVPHGGRLGF